MVDRTLQSFMPKIYKGVKETDEILSSEQKLIDLFLSDELTIYKNTFIMTADEEGIRMYEELLDILPDPAVESLQFRRERVINRLCLRYPFTWPYLVYYILDSFLGAGKYDVNINYNSYTLTLITHIGERNKIEELMITIYKIVPCNIILIAKNEIICYITSELFFAAAISPAFHYQITSNFKKTYTSEGNAYYAGAIDPLLHLMLTNNFSKDYSVSGDKKFGSAPNIGSHLELTGNFKKTYGIEGDHVVGGAVAPHRSYELGEWAAWHQAQGIAYQGGVATPAHKYVLRTFDHVYNIGTPSRIAGVAEKVSQVELTVNSTRTFQVSSPSYAAGAVVRGTRVELTMNRDIHLEVEGHEFSTGAIIGALRTNLTTQSNKTYSASNREYQGGAAGKGSRMSLTMGDDKSYETQGEDHQAGTASLNTTYHIE